MRFRDFSYKSASYRILDECYDQAVKAVKELRAELEGYLASNPPFLDSLVPVDPVDPVPEIALRMHSAARLTGLGPMAAVAGTIAQMACETLPRGRSGTGGRGERGRSVPGYEGAGDAGDLCGGENPQG